MEQINRELKTAADARQKGNEGMARVCARRAAGLAAREFLSHLGMDARHLNALDALRILSQTEHIPAPLREAASTLTIRVTPDHHLPVQVDLLEEAENLIRKLSQFLEGKN